MFLIPHIASMVPVLLAPAASTHIDRFNTHELHTKIVPD